MKCPNCGSTETIKKNYATLYSITLVLECVKCGNLIKHLAHKDIDIWNKKRG